jgi:hypothetical protein
MRRVYADGSEELALPIPDALLREAELLAAATR